MFEVPLPIVGASSQSQKQFKVVTTKVYFVFFPFFFFAKKSNIIKPIPPPRLTLWSFFFFCHFLQLFLCNGPCWYYWPNADKY